MHDPIHWLHQFLSILRMSIEQFNRMLLSRWDSGREITWHYMHKSWIYKTTWRWPGPPEFQRFQRWTPRIHSGEHFRRMWSDASSSTPGCFSWFQRFQNGSVCMSSTTDDIWWWCQTMPHWGKTHWGKIHWSIVWHNVRLVSSARAL